MQPTVYLAIPCYNEEAALPETAMADALDELQHRDLVRPTDAPRRFRFRHPLVRRAVYGSAPAGWPSTPA